MLKRILKYLFYIFILLFQACENLNEPGETEFKNSVILQLQNGNAKQQLYVYHTFPISFSLGDPLFLDGYSNPLANDAAISIIHGDTVYSDFIIEFRDSTKRHKYYTNASNLFIEPNSEYDIKVESNGELIEGHLKTIGDFEIIEVNLEENNAASFSLVNIKWGKADQAKFYSVSVSYKYWFNDPRTGDSVKYSVSGYPFLFDPDTANGENYFSKQLKIRSNADSLEIEINAYDQNSYNYFVEKIQRVGIENAYGYLGSNTSRKVNLYSNKSE
ncbi:MAG: hypothetical protein HND52_17085 [Ignavibacteriae bacterium]|nr:hypothetical protein [Ignavibacteriota bacterium]NOG99676.1 hypothetical protein [Ignavibacteriota bacterium]